ncbi:MAG: CdaR family protein [Eubacteriales bacterium]|nr:CdaR family protein [Eubacteriales bacterium]
MREKINQNLALKAISVVLAFVLWLLVVNISQPEVTGTQTVEIQVRNADRLTSADKTYTMDTRTVRVSYRVRLPQQSRVRASAFEAYVDLADYSITGAVPIYVTVSDELSGIISDVSLSPMVAHVDTEDLQRKRFEITTATTGRTMDGYMAGEISISPDYVYVTGPVSEVGQISEVGIEVNVTEANSSLSGTAPIKFYDANGNAITVDERIKLSREEISYELPVYRIKSLSVVATAEGTPADGYLLESVDTNPDFVDVYGDEEVLSRYSSIQIPQSEISVNGASATVTRSVDITQYVPEGLKLAQPGTEVTIAARIRKLPETSTAAQTEAHSDSEVELEQSTEPSAEAEMEDNAVEEGETTEEASETHTSAQTHASSAHAAQTEAEGTIHDAAADEGADAGETQHATASE